MAVQGWGAVGPRTFSVSRLFPYKTHIVHCVHVRQMMTGLIHCLPPHISKFLDPPLIICLGAAWGNIEVILSIYNTIVVAVMLQV